MNKIIYTEEQVNTLRGLLNGLTVTGIQNAKQVAVMAQVLDEGIPAETREKKEREVTDVESKKEGGS